ncbi:MULTISPECIES: hypothetical protein [unclassified Streptomyces]|nr:MULTISPECIES: hypothetical protein [unclassified Streptomyces]
MGPSSLHSHPLVPTPHGLPHAAPAPPVRAARRTPRAVLPGGDR